MRREVDAQGCKGGAYARAAWMVRSDMPHRPRFLASAAVTRGSDSESAER